MLRSGRTKKHVVADDSSNNLEIVGSPIELAASTEILNPPDSQTVVQSGEGSNSEISSPGRNKKQKTSEQVAAKADHGPPQDISADGSNITAVDLQDTVIALVTEPSLSISWRSSYDNPEKRQFFENGKLKEAVSYLHEQIKSGKASRESLYLKFNYPSCYDIEFLKLLAQEFNADISGILSKKRVAHKEVLNELISKLM
jgi:hypothetical protein